MKENANIFFCCLEYIKHDSSKFQWNTTQIELAVTVVLVLMLLQTKRLEFFKRAQCLWYELVLFRQLNIYRLERLDHFS